MANLTDISDRAKPGACLTPFAPGRVEKASEPSDEHMQRPTRLSQARLLKRVFDIEHCPNCGGALKVIAVIEELAVIVRILTHLGLPVGRP